MTLIWVDFTEWILLGRFYRVPFKSILRVQIKRANDTTLFTSLKFSAKSLTILQRVHPCARSLELDGCALIDLPNKRGGGGSTMAGPIAAVGLWDFNYNF